MSTIDFLKFIVGERVSVDVRVLDDDDQWQRVHRC